MKPVVRPAYSWWRARLSRQIIVPAILVTLLFLAALGFVAFRLGQRAVVSQIEARNRQLATLVGQDITNFFQNVLDTIRLQTQELRTTDTPEAQAAALLALRLQSPYTYGDLWLLDEDGAQVLVIAGTLDQVLNNGPTLFDPPVAASLGPDVAEALATRTITVSPVAFHPITGSPYVTLTLPLDSLDNLDNSSDTTGGAIVAQIDLRSFWTQVDSLRIADGGVSIVDTQGTILAHPDRRRVGQRLDEAAIAPVFAGNASITRYTQNDVTYLAAYSPVRGVLAGWGVIVEQEERTALAPLRTIAIIATLVTVLSAASLALLLLSLVRRVMQPVEQLSKAASAIAVSGDLHTLQGIEISRLTQVNEIGILTTSFNHMITGLRHAQERLQRWNDELEQRVSARTAQLHTIMEIAHLSGASLEEHEVLTTVLGQIERLIDYDAATIMLLDSSGTFLETVATAGATQPRRSRRSLAEYPLNHAVITTRTSVIIADTSREPRWKETGNAPNGAAWMGTPLIVKEQAIGLLALLKRQVGFYNAEDAALMEALASQVAVTIAHARLYEESVRRIERELALAEEIQRHLFPTVIPQIDGLLAAAFYRPARETTGDFYEFIAADTQHAAEGLLGIIVGDVSGKSLPAALLMAMARTALSAAARATPTDPATVLQTANRVLVGDMPRGSFVASSYAAFDAANRTFDLVNAAQPAPLLLRAGQVMLLEGPGSHLPLGVIATPNYETLRITIEPGDLVVFYTDGVIEAHNQHRELFGFERLEEVVRTSATPERSPQQVIEQIIAAVTDWIGTMPQHDDIALMVLRVTQFEPPAGSDKAHILP